MDKDTLLKTLGPPSQMLRALALMTVGSIIIAVAVNGILVPHRFLTGGFTGVSLIATYLFPVLPLGFLYLALNVPLFLLGFSLVSRRFFIYSIAGTAILSLALEWVKVVLPVEDMVTAAVLAGIINGAGGGLILRSQGSAGGSDILSVILSQRHSVRLGTTYLAVDCTVMAVGTLLFPLDKVVYTLIFLFVNSQVINLVVTGLSKRKAVFIITQHWEQMRDDVLKRVSGATLIPAQGSYTGREETLVYCLVTFRELGRLKEIVKTRDPEAVMVVTETLEAAGSRISTQPNW